MDRSVTAATGVVALCLLLSHPQCQREQPSEASTRPTTQPHASRPRGSETITAPHVDCELPQGANVLWCASMQLAWNELVDFAGGELALAGRPRTADLLDRRIVSEADIDAASVVVRAGLVEDGVLDAIRAEMARKFKGEQPASKVMPRWADGPPDMARDSTTRGSVLGSEWTSRVRPSSPKPGWTRGVVRPGTSPSMSRSSSCS